ncbi:beta-1,2-xylosyltransferase [Cicer arietinum]|uniref:Beta-(1,2)-xylosyltransferase n=1 Tax=Cicer arietinum TaxID=3827 RepID=A0A1S2Y7L6_CICAR|nr:beta-(1,2)-xylosyltransferase [Cicer arietinum]
MNKRLLQILLFLFVFNSFSLCLYFTIHHQSSSLNPSSPTLSNSNQNNTPLKRPFIEKQQKIHFSNSKPWPILPSYLPWSQTSSSTPLRSCEGYFGNGFTRRLDVFSGDDGGGWFRCWYSETLRSSVCEGGRVRMVLEKIGMAKGGEDLVDVIGRREEEELPLFEKGAFEIDGGHRFGEDGDEKMVVDSEFLDLYVPRGDIMRHTMRDLISKIRIVPKKEFVCDQWIEEPTLLVTRFEYANLFHTVTDWYSAYVSSRVTGLPNRPHLIFLDGHCKAPLEETWKALFSSLRYAKNFSGTVCFRHAILSPLGYETALFKGLTEDIYCEGASAQELRQKPDSQKTARLSEFGEMIQAAFGLPLTLNRGAKSVSGHNILFVRREDYLAHPRHGGKVESRLSNEAEVFNSLNNWASNYKRCKIDLANGLFAHMSMKEQVRAIQDASVIVGAHGAGLTHIVSALPKTVILEIISSQFRRPHFAYIAQWKGLEYHAINLDGSYANPETVINTLVSIMKSLGC